MARQRSLTLGGYRTFGHNSVALLVDGAAAYPEMLDAIAAAKHAIVLESYVFAPDEAGKRFVEALARRARDGVVVRVLIDGVGSRTTPMGLFAPLRRWGGHVQIFAPAEPWRPWRLWKRDHRKILVVDDQTAFIGGLNIGEDYAPEAWGGRAWHDVHARVDGPAARELTKIVNRTWRRLSKEDWNRFLRPAQPAGITDVQILESRLTQRHSVRRAYLQAIRSARKRVQICNAYCIPDMGVRRALRNAARRGVRVQLLLAGETDMPVVKYAARFLYSRLLRWGVEIYEWNNRVLHAKSAVIDSRWCSLGSYNMDRRSLMHNLEANLACLDERLGAALERQFELDMSRSRAIDKAVWHRRPARDKLLEALCFELRYFL